MPLDTESGPAISCPFSEKPPSNGRATRAQAPAAWVVVATEYQSEGDAALFLESHGFEVRQFLIETRRPALGKRPAYWAKEPAFPGYLIVWVQPGDPIHYLRADSRNGIAGWLHAVGDPEQPAAMPNDGMAWLLTRCVENAWAGEPYLLGRVQDGGRLSRVPLPAEAVPDLSGLEIEIADHPWLSGSRGACLQSGTERVVMLLSMLGAERKVTVRRDAVRVVG